MYSVTISKLHVTMRLVSPCCNQFMWNVTDILILRISLHPCLVITSFNEYTTENLIKLTWQYSRVTRTKFTRKWSRKIWNSYNNDCSFSLHLCRMECQWNLRRHSIGKCWRYSNMAEEFTSFIHDVYILHNYIRLVNILKKKIYFHKIGQGIQNNISLLYMYTGILYNTQFKQTLSLWKQLA